MNPDVELMNIHNYVTDILIKQLRVSYESSLKINTVDICG